ncbi:hypothetical protein VNO78_34673 [Psophocarpus tetragonolobus]|uniref:Uncharacterized protein n=1 Tax=Psophocarpus tetragonolobus TaxID=3891 RepID=A0AAN9NTR2_PSOTE
MMLFKVEEEKAFERTLLVVREVSVYKILSCITSDSYKCDEYLIFTTNEPLDETRGHSSSCFLSPIHSNHFLNPFTSLRFSPPKFHEIGFKAIFRASVSANRALSLPNFHSLNCIIAYIITTLFSFLVSALIGDSNAIILGRVQS